MYIAYAHILEIYRPVIFHTFPFLCIQFDFLHNNCFVLHSITSLFFLFFFSQFIFILLLFSLIFFVIEHRSICTSMAVVLFKSHLHFQIDVTLPLFSIYHIHTHIEACALSLSFSLVSCFSVKFMQKAKSCSAQYFKSKYLKN